jgi:hypothetical protein
MDLLELRRVPGGMRKLLEMEPTQRSSARVTAATRSGSLQPQPTAEEIARVREEKNAEIEKENSMFNEEKI